MERRWAGLALTAALLGGCELPEAPNWEVVVAAPFSSDTLPIIDFLPPVIDTTTVGGQSAFSTAPAQAAATLSLAQMCPPCVGLGFTVVVPEFDYLDSLDVTFPQELAAGKSIR